MQAFALQPLAVYPRRERFLSTSAKCASLSRRTLGCPCLSPTPLDSDFPDVCTDVEIMNRLRSS